MTRVYRMMGVTLLEIMLVLAIAAMIIVMSIRYYSSANTSQNANATVNQIQAIIAGMDNLSAGAGTYAKVDVSVGGGLSQLIGANSMTTFTGKAITITQLNTNSYTIGVPGLPPPVCAAVGVRVLQIPHVLPSSACGSGGTVTVNYDNTQ